LEAGDKLNQHSAELLQKETLTDEDQSKMTALKKAKEKECVDYQTMSGEEMLKLKESCANRDDTSNAKRDDEPYVRY